MKKTLPTILLTLLTTLLFSQERFKLEAKIAFADHYVNEVRSEIPDFMNYTEGADEYFLNDAYLGFKASVGINEQWKSSLDFNFWSMVTPITGDIRATYTPNRLGWNMGLSQMPLEIRSIEEFYSHLASDYNIQTAYYHGHTAFYNNNFYRGVYSGIEYEIGKKRLKVMLIANGGVAFNKKSERYLHFQKNHSNYVFADNYVINASPSLFIKPEIELHFAFIDHDEYQLGIKLEGNLLATVKRMNYTVTHYEWTADSGISKNEILPRHWHHQLTAEGGIYISIK